MCDKLNYKKIKTGTVYIVGYGNPIQDPNPEKQSVLSERVGNMDQAYLFVFMACLFVIRLVCYGFSACRSNSTTVRVKNAANPTFCRAGHYVLSVNVPSYRGYKNRPTIFPHFFSQL